MKAYKEKVKKPGCVGIGIIKREAGRCLLRCALHAGGWAVSLARVVVLSRQLCTGEGTGEDCASGESFETSAVLQCPSHQFCAALNGQKS